MITSRSQVAPDKLVLTFDQLLSKTRFVPLLKDVLRVLETYYKRPVDVEFAAHLHYYYPNVDLSLSLLQCRPLSRRDDSERHQIPAQVMEQDILFTANQMIPHGAVRQIEYLVYINPEKYALTPQNTTRLE